LTLPTIVEWWGFGSTHHVSVLSDAEKCWVMLHDQRKTTGVDHHLNDLVEVWPDSTLVLLRLLLQQDPDRPGHRTKYHQTNFGIALASETRNAYRFSCGTSKPDQHLATIIFRYYHEKLQRLFCALGTFQCSVVISCFKLPMVPVLIKFSESKTRRFLCFEKKKIPRTVGCCEHQRIRSFCERTVG